MRCEAYEHGRWCACGGVLQTLGRGGRGGPGVLGAWWGGGGGGGCWTGVVEWESGVRVVLSMPEGSGDSKGAKQVPSAVGDGGCGRVPRSHLRIQPSVGDEGSGGRAGVWVGCFWLLWAPWVQVLCMSVSVGRGGSGVQGGVCVVSLGGGWDFMDLWGFAVCAGVCEQGCFCRGGVVRVSLMAAFD